MKTNESELNNIFFNCKTFNFHRKGKYNKMTNNEFFLNHHLFYIYMLLIEINSLSFINRNLSTHNSKIRYFDYCLIKIDYFFFTQFADRLSSLFMSIVLVLRLWILFEETSDSISLIFFVWRFNHNKSI